MSRGLPRSLSRVPALTAPSGFQRIRTTFTNASVTVTTITTSNGFGSLALNIPEGFIAVACADAFVSYTTASANVTNATFGSNLSIGTTADADGTLSGTEINIAASTAQTAAVAKTVAAGVVKSAGLVAGILVDNHAHASSLFLNINIAAADMSDGTTATFIVNGFADVICVALGDN